MITKEYGKHILVCDDCLKEVELDSWNESLKYAKDNGWKTEKIDGEWTHTCDECRRSDYRINESHFYT